MNQLLVLTQFITIKLFIPINSLIKKLVKEKKITTITVTHDMQSVYEFSDYTAFIEKGSISWYGKSKEIKKKGNKSLLNFINGFY